MTNNSLSKIQTEQGATLAGDDRMGCPQDFGDPATEYVAACKTIALFDLTDRTSIELRGDDRQSFLHNFCTNDIKRLSPGEGCEAFLTNIKGRILGHIIVSATNEALWLDSEPGTADFIVSHLSKYVITEDVEIADRSAEYAPLFLVGPRAEAWLSAQIEGFTLPPLCGAATGSLASADVMIRRVDFTGQPGFEIIAATEDAADVWNAITGTGVPPAGFEAFEALRIEAGFPRYGIDLTDDNIAQEAGRTAQAISFTKGCYLGQEPIARLDALGHVNRVLTRLTLREGAAPPSGTEVCAADGKPVGHITSAILSPGMNCPVALALLKAAALSSEATLTVNGSPATMNLSATAAPEGGDDTKRAKS